MEIMSNKKMSGDEIEKIARIAASKLFAPNARYVNFELNMILTVGLIGQLQLAFRHEKNTGPTRFETEKFVRRLIEQIDPHKGEVYQFLMLGFNDEYDQPFG